MLVDEEVYIKKSEKIKAETWEEMKYFILSSCIGTFFFYILYEIIFYFSKEVPYQETFSWILSYSISICWQHYLNRKLVFKIGSPVSF
jgi:putative flippase GtrA